MFYIKNVPNWERALRILLSVGAAIYAYQTGYGPLVAGLIASFSLTGIFGFCPMCAMVGRKLDKGKQSSNKI